MPSVNKSIEIELVAAELRREAEEAQHADAMWFYNRILCQTCLPARDTHDNEYERVSGPFRLTIQTPRRFGVPWGIYPRGIFSWLVTEIKKRKGVRNPSRRIELGNSLTDFLEKVTGSRSLSGGRRGNARSFKRQLFSLLTSRIMWSEDTSRVVDPASGRIIEGKGTRWQSMEVSTEGNLFWDPANFDQPGLIESYVTASEPFWEDCMRHGHPIDERVIRALWPNTLAFDIYTWLTYRAYVCLRVNRRELPISWKMLKVQFGPEYATEKQFKYKFRLALASVLKLYPAVTLADRGGQGICFVFNRPSVVSISLPRPAQRNMWTGKPLKLLPPESTQK